MRDFRYSKGGWTEKLVLNHHGRTFSALMTTIARHRDTDGYANRTLFQIMADGSEATCHEPEVAVQNQSQESYNYPASARSLIC